MKTIGVIGSGTLGSHLAGFFAGCGCDVVLFGRRGGAARAKARLPRLTPVPLFALTDSARIKTYNLKEDAARLGRCDWIIECVTEDVAIKHEIYSLVAEHCRDDAVVTSATAGIMLEQLLPAVAEDLRPRFFITHFFFPPRRMKLVEVVTGPDTKSDAAEKVKNFLRDRCGKGVVIAKDAPNFIANRIGAHYVMDAIHRVVEKGWFIEAVDTIMGVPLGRPATGIFEMADTVGIDTIAAVASTAASYTEKDPYAERCRVPEYLQQMIGYGWSGVKGGQGFYKRDGDKILVFDPGRGTYRPRVKFKPRSLIDTDEEQDVCRRMRHLVFAEDQGGTIAWDLMSTMLVHAAEVAGDIADDIESIDKAMRWGYGWALGPFETWDALGVQDVCERLAREGRKIPRLVRDLINAGKRSFYEEERQHMLFPSPFTSAIERNPAGEFSDMGKGLALLTISENAAEFTSRLVELIDHALIRVERDWHALIIAGHERSFTWTYNLYDFLNKARLGKYGDIDKVLKRYQQIAQRIHTSPAPVVMLTVGAVSGVAAEFALAAAHRHAWIETSVWFNHLLLGLVPAAGGCLRMLEHCNAHERRKRSAWKRNQGMVRDGGPHPAVQKAFELIGSVARSQSAYDAKDLGLFAPDDTVTMDRERIVEDGLRIAHTVAAAHKRAEEVFLALPGRGGEIVLKQAMRDYERKGQLRVDDRRVCEHLAHVLTGGDIPIIHRVNEQYILDLEREAFLSLLGTPMTQTRIEHYLKTGKYLR